MSSIPAVGEAPRTARRPLDNRPQDLVITLLGAFLRPAGRESVWSGGLVKILVELGFSIGAARVSLARLARRGLIARIRDGRLVHYTLTPRCEQLLAEGDRRIFSLGRLTHAADAWTVLWHAIPEDQRIARGRLARRLRFLGFGSVQDGIWASPHDREEDVTDLLHALEIADSAVVLVGRPAKSLDFGSFVARVWNLDELAARYEAFVTDFSEYLSDERRDQLPDRETFLVRTRLIHTFRRFPFDDPELPDTYMPQPSHRAEAIHIFHTLYAALQDRAQRYFDAVTMRDRFELDPGPRSSTD